MNDEVKNGDNGQSETAKTATEPAPPKKMEPGDRLRAENLQLKILNLTYQEEVLESRLEMLRKDRSALQRKYVELKKQLEQKYNVNLSTSEVRPSDGAIVPTGTLPTDANS